MIDSENSNRDLLHALSERAKELQCLYKVKEIVNKDQLDIDNVLPRLADIIPFGWQYPDLCCVRIRYKDKIFQSSGFEETRWYQKASLDVNDKNVGSIEIFYKGENADEQTSPFLEEEQVLLNTIAERVENYLFQRDIQISLERWEKAEQDISDNSKAKWKVILELVEKMDNNLFRRICRRMLNRLCLLGIEDAQGVLGCIGMKKTCDVAVPGDINIPSSKIDFSVDDRFNRKIIEIASRNLSDAELLSLLNKWIKEDKIGFLIQVLENSDTSLSEISSAVSRYHHLNNDYFEISSNARNNINSLFMQRIFTEQIEFIKVARDSINIDDFYPVLQRIIFPNNSHGKLGGKSTGLFLSAQILKNEGIEVEIPKTWYVSSDYLLNFIYYNNLEEALEKKYLDIEEIRADYPNLVQVFKNSGFPKEYINGLKLALEEIGDKPLIVRSSSLLEDRYGTAFSGKYKSLFLANQGTKEENLNAIMDAIAEVYASVFGPDPIEYRKEHGLLEFHEEMAIIIQEVVGVNAGKYYFPSFAGVGFSHNEFRWSPRIKKEDGLLRIVPGLGTRAVDRLSDDYPILVCPSNPDIKVNPDPVETFRYSPRRMDVINTETNRFETVEVSTVLKECGSDFPDIRNLVMILKDGILVKRNIFQLDYQDNNIVFTLDPLIENTGINKKFKQILDVLKEKMNAPVDIEFACCNGRIYLLQCRPQAASAESAPSPIPQDLSESSILFNAKKHVGNGKVDNITHIVYVDPDGYNSLGTLDRLEKVGRAVSGLNSILPKRQFILIGPGRWGSRGDIKLGVKVNYSDIKNTAMLIEVARKKGDYVPELSFGTHFFQDLVESAIKYLPLYPDNEEIIFDRVFLTRSENILPAVLPAYADLSNIIFVIDVARETDGKVLKIAMNEDLNEAVAYFSEAEGETESESVDVYSAGNNRSPEFWRWRLSMAEKIAQSIDPEEFGVKAVYIFGSTKNATAGPMSDIDLLIHIEDSALKKDSLTNWLRGWSLCLGQINYLKTGYKTRELLDIHFITDRDIAEGNSFAVKIGAVTDPARELQLGKGTDD